MGIRGQRPGVEAVPLGDAVTSWISRFPRPKSGSFARPPSVRQLMNTQQQAATGERYVYSEDELRAAISEVTSRFEVDAAGFFMAGGGSIVVAGSFTVQEPITIPWPAVLLTIRALAGSRISPVAADQGALFIVQSAYTTIRDLFVFYGAIDGLPSAYFTTLVELEETVNEYNIDPDRCSLIGNQVWAERLYVDETSAGDDAIIANNFIVDVGATADACVHITSKRCAVQGNRLDQSTGDVVTLGAGAEWCSIVGNHCDLNDITSSASSGENVISSNVRVGTITSHATDAVGLNT